MSLLSVLLLGVLFGSIGQFVRVIVGFKKVWDDSQAANTPFSQLFDMHRFLISLALGVVVGGLAGLLTSFVLTVPASGFTKDQIMLLIATGYAGTDAFEALFTKAAAK